MKELVKQINCSKEPFPVKAAIFHFAFEKIHPFLDGNGRAGRLLAVFILKQGGFDFRGPAQSTLHYDLRKLTEEGFVKKLGSTRGVRYSVPFK